jgi:type IV secretory pathway protease TraF
LPARLAALFCGGNRVLVDRSAWDYADDGLARLVYSSGLPRTLLPPKRWDVIVFRCPVADVRLDGIPESGVRIDEGGAQPVRGSADVKILEPQKTFIKRLIGLPGETIRIRHGDIYVNGHLAVRPPEVQNAHWQFVYDSADVAKRSESGVPAAWIPEEGGAELDGATLRLTAGSAGRAEARYARPINDVSAHSGYSSGPYYPVGEIKWDVEVTLDRAGMLRLAVDEDEMRYVGAVRFGTASAKTNLHVAGHDIASVESEFAAEPGKSHRVIFSNASGRLELTVDGVAVLSCEHPMPENDLPVSSGAALSVESAQAEFSRVRLCRSIYYRPPERNGTYAIDVSGRNVMTPDTLTRLDGYRIPEGQYLVLGDNQPSSWDSRFWGMVPQRNLIGRGVVLWWPVRMLRAIY